MTPDDDRKPHQHFKEGEWNSYHVVACGNRIETWINGHPISDLVHDERYESHPEGFIGLQVHGIAEGTGPYEVSWRNLKLRDLSKFETLYSGKDLSGWKRIDHPKLPEERWPSWVVQGGMIVATGGPGALEYQERLFGDLCLQIEVRTRLRSNWRSASPHCCPATSSTFSFPSQARSPSKSP